jgi:isopentenyl diphosphate isomerase/L-lactate dehydrogenase-like FMN-dependent dehydrogenase
VVIAQPPEDKTLGYWGTPKIEDALETPQWPRVYRERNERQEHRFTRMNDHGARKTNEGRKKIVGPDRQQQRKREKLDQSLEAAHQRVDKQAEALKAQQGTRAEAEATGHGKRLEPRQRALVVVEKDLKDAQNNHAKLTEHASAIGPPKERADRDFRTQTIMTFRTLL